MERTDSPLTLSGTTRLIGDRLILELDAPASELLPSRGQVAVEVLDGAHAGQVLVIEPDGRRGHWLPLDRPEDAFLGTAPENASNLRFNWPPNGPKSHFRRIWISRCMRPKIWNRPGKV